MQNICWEVSEINLCFIRFFQYVQLSDEMRTKNNEKDDQNIAHQLSDLAGAGWVCKSVHLNKEQFGNIQQNHFKITYPSKD